MDYITTSIKLLQLLIDDGYAPIGTHNAIMEGIKALQSEIPAKPIYLEEYGEYFCNDCGMEIEIESDYCSHCGQKQYWNRGDNEC